MPPPIPLKIALGPSVAWWQSAWMQVSTFVAALSVGFLCWFKRLKARYQQQVLDLEVRTLLAQMNPHFLFNSLNSIQSFLLQNDKNSAIEYLNSFSRLVRGMLNASVVGEVTLADEVQLLKNYLSLEQLRFNNCFSYTINVEDDLDVNERKIPPLLVQPYVENAILHGMADVSEGGWIEVGFAQSNGHLVITIKDNGKGYAKHHASAHLAHRPFGLNITGRRLALMSKLHGEALAETTFLDETQKTGTLVTIKMKNTEV